MLPGFRILFALVVLSFAILVFGFGALALLRTAHQNLASQPVWQRDWRTPVEIANARRDDRQASPNETQTLALLRVEPAAQSETPPAQPQGQDAQTDRPPVDTEASPPPQPASVSSPSGADTNDHDKSVTVAVAAEVGAPAEKTADRPTTSVPPTDDPGKLVDPSDVSKVADAVKPQNDRATPPPTEPDTSTTPAKTSEGEPPRDIGDVAPTPLKSEPPMKLAALPDAPAASNEPRQQARQQSARQPDAAQLRAKRRARARLRARRLALARARAARLAQTQQTTTNAPYYNSNFTTTGSSVANATPNATPFGAPRAAP